MLTFINCYSVQWATRVQDIFTYAKLLALFIIIAVGIYLLAQGLFDIQNACMFCFVYLFNIFSPCRRHRISLSITGNVQYFTFKDTKTEVTSLALSFYSGLFAYNGWNYLNFIIEELKDPVKNLPKAIAISLVLVTLVYLFTNIGKFTLHCSSYTAIFKSIKPSNAYLYFLLFPAFYTILSPDEVLGSEAVAVTFANRTFGMFAFAIPSKCTN